MAGSSLTSPIPHTLSPHACIEFVNSRFADHTGSGAVHDRLALAEWRGWFARRCGMAAAGEPGFPHDEVVALRALLRGLLDSGRPPRRGEREQLNDCLARSPRWPHLTSELELETCWEHDGWPALMATVAASYCELLTGGELRRVRRCANPHCTWLFFDESRNGSRRWCDPGTCGNLLAVRRHRR